MKALGRVRWTNVLAAILIAVGGCAYADPKGCRCLYVGTEKEYQEYQRLAFQRELADKQLKAAREYSNAVMTWGTWGPWPWF